MKTLTAIILLWCTTFCAGQSVVTTFRRVTAAAAPSGPPTYVQSCNAYTWSSAGAGASCVITSAAVGDVLLIGVRSATVNPTVTVNGTTLSSPIDTAKGSTVAIFMYANIPSGNTPVVVQTTDSGVSRLVVAEFSNVGSSPMDGHTMGTCDTGCVYGSSISTPTMTVGANDLIWVFCGNDYAGEGASMGPLPANDYTAIDTTNLGGDFASGYRVQTTAGSTVAQCKVAADSWPPSRSRVNRQ
ncbi:MAG: hypothetical protein JST61_15900 [Acidobacteria bacterium]|nr:hypothetical protein [Acidobacteriota bacterium]